MFWVSPRHLLGQLYLTLQCQGYISACFILVFKQSSWGLSELLWASLIPRSSSFWRHWDIISFAWQPHTHTGVFLPTWGEISCDGTTGNTTHRLDSISNNVIWLNRKSSLPKENLESHEHPSVFIRIQQTGRWPTAKGYLGSWIRRPFTKMGAGSGWCSERWSSAPS